MSGRRFLPMVVYPDSDVRREIVSFRNWSRDGRIARRDFSVELALAGIRFVHLAAKSVLFRAKDSISERQ